LQIEAKATMSLFTAAQKFRCFDKIEEVELRPLTILVGENSAGKSSFLALIRYLVELTSSGETASFNKEPFFLGSYEQIAFNPGGKSGRSDQITFQFKKKIDRDEPARRTRFRNSELPDEVEYTIVLKNIASQAQIDSLLMKVSDVEVFSDFTNRVGYFKKGDNKYDADLSNASDANEPGLIRGPSQIAHLIYAALREAEAKSSKKKDFRSSLFDVMDTIQTASWIDQLSVHASAPVRTAPQRTYNPTDQVPVPDGSHVLNMLATLKRTNKEKWKALKQELDRFGVASGLFRSFDIRLLGGRESDPFQAQVKIGGIPSNLIDVGYGISQVIPIIFEISQAADRYILLQQPEVHLHPRAQAGLGSFLLAASTSRHIVIETHSDYLIDQVRIDLRKSNGKIRPDDIAIYYFERSGTSVSVRRLPLDDDGNFTHTPVGYRNFFVQHENTLLGLDNVSDR
jgi:hypothetical protein